MDVCINPNIEKEKQEEVLTVIHKTQSRQKLLKNSQSYDVDRKYQHLLHQGNYIKSL